MTKFQFLCNFVAVLILLPFMIVVGVTVFIWDLFARKKP